MISLDLIRETLTGQNGNESWDIQTSSRNSLNGRKVGETYVKRNALKSRSVHKPFVVWDGEGYSQFEVNSSGIARSVHHYCLFGNSESEYITARSLGTFDCFKLLLRSANDNRARINIAFSFEYDVNMILKDVSRKHMRILRLHNKVRWNGFTIEHIPSKWFSVSRGTGENRSAIKIFDVFSFFQKSLLKCLKEFVPDLPDFDRIEQGKSSRDSFFYTELKEFILPYWDAENKACALMMERFRDILFGAGLKIKSWHGPGALADYLFKKHNIAAHMQRELPHEIILASQYAFAAGRFELFKAGRYIGPVYSYDLNSAHPSGMSNLPSLRNGKWERTNSLARLSTATNRLGFVRLRMHVSPNDAMLGLLGYPFPLFARHRDGTVSFPPLVNNWYHLSEAQLVLSSGIRGITILDGWLFHDDGSYPFDFIPEMYDTRRQWKLENNPSQLGLKLGLNSLFGKTAQRVGWNTETSSPPKWHQLEWAGAITANTRRLLWEPAKEAAEKNGLISIDTDGIYSTVPLTSCESNIGSDLGQWEKSLYNGIMVLQSGIYWLLKDGEWLPPKTRGIPQKQLSAGRAVASLECHETLVASQRHFVKYGEALHRDFDSWREWRTDQREFIFGGTGKRRHSEKWCQSCKQGFRYSEGLHNLSITRFDGRSSYVHPLPWRGTDNRASSLFQEQRDWGDYDD